MSTAAIYLMDITQNTQLEARFTKQKYTLSVSTTAGGEATGSGSYEHGAQATVKATPETGYRFTGWYENNVIISTDVRTNLEITKNRDIIANFEKIVYAIQVAAENAKHDSHIPASGTHTLQYGERLSVNAVIANADAQTFEGWYDQSGKHLGSSTTLNLTNFEGITKVIGKFETKKYTVSFSERSEKRSPNFENFKSPIEYGTYVTVRAANSNWTVWDCNGLLWKRKGVTSISFPLYCNVSIDIYNRVNVNWF